MVIIENRNLRTRTFVKFRKKLDQTGSNIDRAMNAVMGTRDLSVQGFNLDDFERLCRVNEFDADRETVLRPILECFDRDIFGDIPCKEIIVEFNKAQQARGGGAGGDDDEGGRQKSVVEAARYLPTTEESISEAA